MRGGGEITKIPSSILLMLIYSLPPLTPPSHTQDQCARYWPESLNSPEKQGSLTLELLSEGPFEDYIMREIKVTDVTVSFWIQYIHTLVHYIMF